MTEVVGISRARVVSMAVAAAGAAYAWSIGEQYVAFFAVLLGFMNYSERQAEQAA